MDYRNNFTNEIKFKNFRVIEDSFISVLRFFAISNSALDLNQVNKHAGIIDGIGNIFDVGDVGKRARHRRSSWHGREPRAYTDGRHLQGGRK